MTDARTILLAEDEERQRSILARCLREWGYDVVDVPDGNQAAALLEAAPFALVITDIRMPGKTGLDLLETVRHDRPALPVLLITAFPDVREAVDATREGVVDYLTKPLDLDELHDLVGRVLGEARGPVAGSLPELPEDVVMRSPHMRHLLREAYLVADSAATVLLSGESGTGKEVFTDIIHAWSGRAAGPLVKLNCAAIPTTMMESEVFGHRAGAFTGAAEARQGRWQAADGGTLMLDEIGEMPPALQTKLLRSLQDGSYSPLGSDETLVADVRVVAATNKDLEEEVAAGRFREDLYYRLNVVELNLPPLRERREDIAPLAKLFARRFNGAPARMGQRTEALLRQYQWPGNIRELRNIIERACLLARGDVLLPEHLPGRVVEAAAGAPGADPGEDDTSGAPTLADVEKRTILAALARCKGNRTRAARELGIGRRTLIYKLKSYSEEPDE